MAIGSFIQSNTQEGAFTAVNSSAATMVGKEGYFVTPTGNTVTLEAASGGKYMEMVLVSAVTDDPIYLLQAGAAASKPIEVLPLSPHRNLRCVAGGTITANELLTVHSDGTAVSAVNGSTIIGYAEEDAAAGGYVKFRPVSPGLVNSTATACNAKLDAVTAAGSGQGDGAMADTSQGAFVVASGGDGTKVITLPAASNAAGYQCEIYNNSASNLPVFPATGGAINGGSANAAVTIATYTIARVVCIAANTLAISEQAKA